MVPSSSPAQPDALTARVTAVSPAVARGPLGCAVVSDVSADEALAASWAALGQRGARDELTASPEWLLPLWHAFGGRRGCPWSRRFAAPRGSASAACAACAAAARDRPPCALFGPPLLFTISSPRQRNRRVDIPQSVCCNGVRAKTRVLLSVKISRGPS
jgi:hypothetical protein